MTSPSPLSSTEVLLAFFPRIKDELISIMIKFKSKLEYFIDYKTKQINFTIPQATEFLTHFPRHTDGYKASVDRFVNFGKQAPQSAIALLLKMVPNKEGNFLYNELREKVQFFGNFENLLNLFLLIFFADCVAQILSLEPNTIFFDDLINLGYENIAPGYESYEEPLRIQLISQYSVIFSFLSINKLDVFIERFPSVLEKSDPCLCILLHRFLRLTASANVKIAQIAQFLNALEKMGINHKKNTKVITQWATSLCPLLSQLNTDGCPELSLPLERIYSMAMKKTHDRTADLHILLLCGNILLRDTNLYKKNFENFFYNNVLLKANKPHRVHASLQTFISVIRGHFVSRSTLFWEWGSFNANGQFGIEATQLSEPNQIQSNENSYTNLFFKHFVKVAPIDKYPDLVGQILVNFAARDFNYFSTTTLPRFIQEMEDDRWFLPLNECLSTIVNPALHFAEWAQENPLNCQIQIVNSIPVLFNQLKPMLFSISSKYKSEEKTEHIFSFTLTDSMNYLKFQLPCHTDDPFLSTEQRIIDSTNKISKFLQSIGFNSFFTTYDESLPFQKYIIENITPQEEKEIQLLEFYPRIVNQSDLLANNLLPTLLDTILNKSPAVGLFAIKVVNCLFAAMPSSRNIIYNEIINKLAEMTNPVHIFIILELFIKLFDLSLQPQCKLSCIKKFINKSQSLAIYLMSIPIPEIRDLSMSLIERIYRFSNSYQISCPLFDILNNNSKSIANAAINKLYTSLKCPYEYHSRITFNDLNLRDVATSRYTLFLTTFLCETLVVLEYTAKFEIIEFVHTFVSNALKRMDQSLYYQEFFYNLSTLLLQCAQDLTENETSSLNEILPHETSYYYNFSIIKYKKQKTKQKLEGLVSSTIDIIKNHFDYILNTTDFDVLYKKCFFNTNWTWSIKILYEFSNYFQTNGNVDDLNQLLSVVLFFKAHAQNPEISFSLLASEDCRNSFYFVLEATRLYFIKNNLNQNERATPAILSDDYLVLALNFCTLLTLFLNAMVVEPIITKEGPLKAPKYIPWLETKRFSNFGQKSIIFLLNWSSYQHEKHIELSKFACNTISAFIRVTNIFDNSFTVIQQIHPIILNSEIQGWRTFKFALLHHFDQFIRLILSHTYDKPPEIANIFFYSICSIFIQLTSNKKKYGIKPNDEVHDSRTQLIYQTLKGDHESQDSGNESNIALTDEDIRYNINILKYSGNILLSALLYLMNENYNIRFMAFQLILRLAPLTHQVLSPKEVKKTNKIIRRLNNFASSFYSSYVTITPELVLKVIQLLASELPQLAESIVQECFFCIKLSHQSNCSTLTSQQLLLDCANVFLSCETFSLLSNTNTIFTPESLLNQFLSIYDSINPNLFPSYLSLWKIVAINQESIDYIISFLLEKSREDIYRIPIRTILVYLAQTFPTSVVPFLTSQLSFSCWFYTNLQGKLNNDEPPVLSNFYSIEVVIIALTEIAQASNEYLNSQLHIILNFCILFFESDVPRFSEILFVILSAIIDIPEEVSTLLLPPIKLSWNSDSEKKPIIILVEKLHKFFINRHGGKNFMKNWGSECLRWACGCGDLSIASKATKMFSIILRPFDHSIILSIVHSAYIVASCPLTDESQEYLMSVFMVLSAAVNKFCSNKAFVDSFKLLFNVAKPFISFPECPDLCNASLSLIAKCTIYSTISKKELLSLISTYSYLYVSLNMKRILNGAVLALFKSRKSKNVCLIAFIIFLPHLFSAFAAYHNIEPYSSSLSDYEIPKIIQAGLLMISHKSMPDNLSIYLQAALEKPDEGSVDEFALQCGIQLASQAPDELIKAAPLLLKMATKANDVLLSAIFRIIRCFLEYPKFEKGVELFSPIVPIAASSALPEAILLLESFVNLSAKLTQIPEKGWETRFFIETKEPEWSTVSKELQEVFEDRSSVPEGNTDLTSLIYIVPLDKDMWKQPHVEVIRKELNGLIVQPYTDLRNDVEKYSNIKLIENDDNELLYNNLKNFYFFTKEEEEED